MITEATKEFFKAIVADSGNWGGEPLLGEGSNIAGDIRQHRGFLTALKKAGLVTSFTDRGDTFVRFTEAGRTYAKEIGMEVRE